MPTSPTHVTVRATTLRFLLAGALGLSLVLAPASRAATIATFVPIGAGYAADTLEQFAAEAAIADASGEVSILVLPIAYGVDPLYMSNGLRNQNLSFADNRRGQIEDACLAVVPATETCDVVLAPVLVRDDAFDPANVALVKSGLDGIFVLGGDQTVAMGVVADTPFEDALADAYAAGAVTGGNSAGAAVESADMIAGYTGNNGPEQGLERGAVDLWLYGGPNDRTRGLVYGLPDVLLDQHVFQRGRIARLISASFGIGELGIGLDADTAGTIVGGTNITKVGGASAGYVADSLTYSSQGRYDGSGTLSIHDVATHVLPPGDGYELATRRPVVSGVPAAAPDIAARTFPSLATPAGSGPLLLAGGSPSDAVLDRLVTASGNPGSTIVVLATGYAKPEIATKDAKAFAAELSARGASAPWFVLNAKTNTAGILSALASADGVLVTAPDPATVLASLTGNPSVTEALESAWLGGAAVLANDAAASALSAAFTTDPRPGATTGQIESAAISEFRPDSTTPVAGLGWADIAVEPGIVSNRHWGRLYNLLPWSASADRLALGIDAGTAVEFGPALTAPLVVGDSAAVLLDGRYGSFGTGSNGALAAHWVILDTYVSAPGDRAIGQ
jgi:cyanophycinase